jgi:hypothetical protein
MTADTVELTAEQLARLTSLPPAAGEHNNDEQMQLLER